MKSLLGFLLLVSSSIYAEESFKSEVIYSKLNAPWAVAQGPDNTFYITEKTGKIVKIKNGRKVGELFGIPSDLLVFGQGGLMDIIFDPDYAKNKKVYLTYTTKKNVVPRNGANTRVSSFILENNKLTNEKILVQGGYGTDGAHFGSRIAFDKKGLMYVTFGERHNKEKAQDLSYLNGKVIRIDRDGRIPKDNPFVNNDKARPEVFTYGHRNPQGISIHPEYDVAVISEHGPTHYDANINGRSYGNADEINWLRSGANYGWPILFGDPKIIDWSKEMVSFLEKSKALMPIIEFSKPDGIAPSGVIFYSKDNFAKWKNQFFVACLRGYIVRIKMDENGQLVKSEKMLTDKYPRLRDLEQGNDGNIYIISDTGDFIKLSPKSN